MVIFLCLKQDNLFRNSPCKLPLKIKLLFFSLFKDDPWMAAHQFLERNDLSQMFLDQVVDFILKNTKGVTIGQQGSAAGDPFTGEEWIKKKKKKKKNLCIFSSCAGQIQENLS